MKHLIWASAVLIAGIPANAAQGPKLHTDNYGTYYLEYIWTSNPQIGSGFHKHYVKRFVNLDKPEEVIGVSTTSPETLSKSLGDPPVLNEDNRQAAIKKADSKGAVIDKSLGVSDYRFGEAGGPAAATAFAYGVAVQIATDPAQAQRIERLREEVQALDNALKAQTQTYQDEGAAFSAIIAKRGNALDIALKNVAALPAIDVGDPIPLSPSGSLLFATHDPFFALRLNRLIARLSSGRTRLTGDLRETGLAAIRLADVEHARGEVSTAESFVRIAKTVADFGLGLDPITGTVRGVYELVTGLNLVTGAPLTPFERGLSLLNVATIGGFGTLAEATRAVAMLGHVLGGIHLTATKAAIQSVRKFFRASVIDRLVQFRSEGKAVIEEGTILFEKAKPLSLEFPSDGRFARVVPKGTAAKLAQGAQLSKEDMAFVTAAEDLKGFDSQAGLAKRLALYVDPTATKLKSLEDHVLVEFKFTPPDNPLVSTPIGNAGSWGNGWVPGGLTRGGAREWIVDSKAVSNGLIDPSTIRIQAIPKL